MKISEIVVVVDSVEKAVKFYTERLGFDVVELAAKGGSLGVEQALSYARVKKGKCFLRFRLPVVEELADFSFIKRCVSRSTGLYVLMKKGLDKYFDRCRKKGVPILHELREEPWGVRSFSIKDPFGIKLTFVEPIEGAKKKNSSFHGLELNPSEIKKDDKELIDKMTSKLKSLGILRRAAKKYSKLWIKNYLK